MISPRHLKGHLRSGHSTLRTSAQPARNDRLVGVDLVVELEQQEREQNQWDDEGMRLAAIFLGNSRLFVSAPGRRDLFEEQARNHGVGALGRGGHKDLYMT